MLSLIFKHPINFKTLLAQVQPVHGVMQKYFIHNKNVFSITMAVRMFLTRCARSPDGATRPVSFLRPNGLRNVLIQHRQMSQLDVNTNVKNNVILYKYERPGYFRNLKLFAIGQLTGWLILAFYTYKPSFWDIFYSDLKFKEYWFNHMFRLPICLFSLFAGPLMLFIVYATCARSIKYIILNKGGETLSIITYNLRKKKSNINLPIGMVKCITDRTAVGGWVSLKIKNRSLYYLVDKQGTFVNPKLFDYATG